MDEQLTQRVHGLLMQAYELDTEARRAFVTEACENDSRLHQHMRQLLEAVDQSNYFLESSAWGQPLTEHANPRLEPGATIGNYRILRVIGEGGMATVYEALQARPQRRVALKVPHHGRDHASHASHRLRYETEVLARLQHPGIAQIYEAGSWKRPDGGSVPYFAMEFIPHARTIVTHASELPLPIHDRLSLFTTVCDAVHYGHQRGVIHCDLKPANILIDEEGRPKVIDFGIASSADPSLTRFSQQADNGRLVGTLHYMSPEQCSADHVPDVRTDVYGLGVVLYELLCECLPHHLTGLPLAESFRIIEHDAPMRPSRINRQVCGDLEAVVLKAIEKDRERRYRSVDAFRTDIRRFLHLQPVEARPTTALHQCCMFARRNRALVVALLAVLIAVLAGSILSAMFGYRAWRESQQRLLAESQAVQERDAAIWQAYVANIAGAFAADQAHEYRLLRSRLASARDSHRNWEWHFLYGLAEPSDRKIVAHDDMVFDLCGSRDSSRLLTACRDGSLRVWDPNSGRLLLHIDGTPDEQMMSATFNPDGTLIVSGSEDGHVYVWSADNGQQIRRMGDYTSAVDQVSCGLQGLMASASRSGDAHLWQLDSGAMIRKFDSAQGLIHGLEFCRDGKHLLTWNHNGQVRLRSADGLQVIRSWDVAETFLEDAAISASGSWIAAGGGRGRVWIWNAHDEDLSSAHEIPVSPNTVRSVQFSPLENLLAAGQIDRGITLLSVPDGEQVAVLRGHEEAVSGMWFTDDNKSLHSSSWDRTWRTWRLDDVAKNRPISTAQGHTDAVIAIAYSPNGQLLASGSWDKTVRLWDSELGCELGVLRGHHAGVYSVAFSPDGKTLASGSQDDSVRLWDVATGAQVATLAGHHDDVWTVAFSVDGQRIASAGDDTIIRIWDVASHEQIRQLKGHAERVVQVAFSPNGQQLASASRDHTVRIWGSTTGKLLFELIGHQSDVFAVQFSRDGRQLYTGSRDQTVRVWDTASGECLHILGGHGQFITSLSLSPDGSRLAAGSWFGRILLWDLPSHDLVAAFSAHERAIRDVAFSPDGRFLSSASLDATIHIHDSASPSDRAQRRGARR